MLAFLLIAATLSDVENATVVAADGSQDIENTIMHKKLLAKSYLDLAHEFDEEDQDMIDLEMVDACNVGAMETLNEENIEAARRQIKK